MLRFSTRDVPERERLAYVHDFIARHVAGLAFTPADDDGFQADLAVALLPDAVAVGRARYSPVAGARTRELLGDGRANYRLTLHDADYEYSVEGGPWRKARAGDLVIVSEGTPIEFRLPAASVQVVSLDRAKLAARIPAIEREPAHFLPRGAPGVALFAGYADLLAAAPPQGMRAGRLAAAPLYDLAALLFEGGAGEGTSPGVIGAARLELVKKGVLARLADPALSVEAVARRQGVTPRYVQRLFASEGTTFSEFLRDARLALAQRLLGAADGRSIAAIAYDAGFSDLSGFNRAFRRRYGLTPSDIRAEAIRRRSS